MSHEIHTPMSAMLSFIDLALEENDIVCEDKGIQLIANKDTLEVIDGTTIDATIFADNFNVTGDTLTLIPPPVEAAASLITAWMFDPSGTSSLTFTGVVSAVYNVQSADALTGTFTTITPSGVTSGGTLAGDIITVTQSPVTVEFLGAQDLQFYQINSNP